MLRSPSTKLSFALLAALVLIVAIVGLIVEYAHERSQLWIHAAATTGGNPERGEALCDRPGLERLLEASRHAVADRAADAICELLL